MKTCRLCLKSKELSEFRTYKTRIGKESRHRNECRACNNLAAVKYGQDNTDYRVRASAKQNDRMRGQVTTITRNEVYELLNLPCKYCGVKEERMTIDRRDNDVGHTYDNCVPCCISCNIIKRDMPIQAWLHIAPSIREAKEMGLFGEWKCLVTQVIRPANFKSRKTDSTEYPEARTSSVTSK